MPTPETSLVLQWLTEERAAFEIAQSLAGLADDDAEAGEEICEFVHEMIDDHRVKGLMRDLIKAALNRVDWPMIGRRFRAL